MKGRILALMALLALIASCSAPSDGIHSITVLTTGDIHGRYFDDSYVGGSPSASLIAVSALVDSVRKADGERNVILLDAGDILQGDNAAYYYNYVETRKPHIYPRMASYMGYDACVVGNHDTETGHQVYDRVRAQLGRSGIPFLGGNALKPSGKSYFRTYTVLRKGGLKVAVLGFDNANIKAWLSEELWSGMEYVNLIPRVQECVDWLKASRHPDLVIVAVHSGTGEGDASMLESQGLDLFRSLEGVDLVIGAHDHRPYTEVCQAKAFVNGGSHCKRVGLAKISSTYRDGVLESREVEQCTTLAVDPLKIDSSMKERFAADYEAVKVFTNREVGSLAMDLRTRDAYRGMCDYLNLIHTVQLSVPEADLSLAAPLTFNGQVKAGKIVFNDMFTIYPFENQLFVAKLKGSEILSLLELSYDRWIQDPGDHVLRIRESSDPRTGTSRWSFENRSYNFDSCGGLVYDVVVNAPYGSRIVVKGLADGRDFNPEEFYNVAMTSYRANGGGELIPKGAGISSEEMDGRIVARYPEIRELIYRFFNSCDVVCSESVGKREVIGQWRFVPEELVSPLMEKDLNLIF